ncbi:MAG: WD40 repeat domain-containing protein [Gemmataceae bacterium]
MTGPDFETVTRKFTVRRGANPVYTVELILKRVPAGARRRPGSRHRLPHPSPVRPAVPAAEKVQCGTDDDLVPVRELSGHAAAVNAMGYSADGKRVITGSADKTAAVWDPETGDRISRLTGHTATVFAVALSPDGKRALTGGVDGMVGLWDADSGELLHRFDGHDGGARSVAFSPDGRLAASAGADRIIRLYDVGKQAEIRQLTGHNDLVSSVAFAPTSDRLVSGSWDQTVRLWDVNEGKPLKQFLGHTGFVLSVAYSPDGKRLLSGSGGAMKGNQYHGQADCSVRLWDVDSRKELLKLSDDWGGVCTVAFLPESRYILFAEWRPLRADRFLFLWDTESNEEIARYQDPGAWAPTVAVATNGRQVAIGRGFNADHRGRLLALPRQPASK